MDKCHGFVHGSGTSAVLGDLQQFAIMNPRGGIVVERVGGDLVQAMNFINNRLEGNALNTIAAILGCLD